MIKKMISRSDRRLKGLLCAFVVLLILTPLLAESAEDNLTPLLKAHAHNDYEHDRPLIDALSHGFCSVEADIFLIDGDLLVAHDLKDVTPERTLRELYLDPLLARFRANDGAIYPGGGGSSGAPRHPAFTLLIDIKSDANSTWETLSKTLEDYREMLTQFTDSEIKEGAVTVFISGARPRETLLSTSPRLAAMDGRIADLDSDATPLQIPLISDNWRLHFRWWGREEFPESEREKLHEIVNRAHAQGRLVRFWATADRPEVWSELVAAGVDYINVDDLAGLEKFLRAHPNSE